VGGSHRLYYESRGVSQKICIIFAAHRVHQNAKSTTLFIYSFLIKTSSRMALAKRPKSKFYYKMRPQRGKYHFI
jgi:hypothetical protein